MRKEFEPLVSIIIPVYNGANYMREAIHSALAQTYPNVEVLVINDGSTDEGETERVARSYGDRIRYFQKPNGGVATALNMGIENMRGEYFSWLSHDDVYRHDKIAKQIEWLSTSDDAETIVYSGYILIDEKSRVIAEIDSSKVNSLKQLNTPLFSLFRGLIHGCSLLIHKKHFERAGLFDPKLRSTQDYDLWFSMFRGAKLNFLPHLLIQSRVHSEQGTHKITNHIEECNDLWRKMIENLTEDEMKSIDGSELRFYVNQCAFLEKTPYKGAYDFAKKRMAGAIERLHDKKISVVIPFVNRIPLLLESAKSAQEQTHTNLEILLVDDGSTDCLDPIMELIQHDPRIRYIGTEHNGPAAARNVGIREATGEYIAFLDSDDLFRPKKLEKQLEYMERNNFVISHTSYQRMDNGGKLAEVVETHRLCGRIFPDVVAGCIIATPTVMARREVFLRRKFEESFKIGEDICLWIDIAYEYEFGAINEPLTSVRVSGSSASMNQDKQLQGLYNIIGYVLRHPGYSRCRPELKQLVLLFLGILVVDSPEIPFGQQASFDAGRVIQETGILVRNIAQIYEQVLESAVDSKTMELLEQTRELIDKYSQIKFPPPAKNKTALHARSNNPFMRFIIRSARRCFRGTTKFLKRLGLKNVLLSSWLFKKMAASGLLEKLSKAV